MDNASKNAGDMIGRLQMQYNRGRQASITNELVDIITGSWLSSRFVRGSADLCPRCQRLVISENSLESGIDPVARRYPVILRSIIRCSLSGLVPPKSVAVTLATWIEPPTTPGCFTNLTLTMYYGLLRASGRFVWCMNNP